MEILTAIFSGLSAIAALISAIAAVKSAKRTKEIEKSLMITTKGNLSVSNIGQNSGAIIGIDAGNK